MSRIVNMIAATDTGDRRVFQSKSRLFNEIFDGKSYIQQEYNPAIGVRYKIEVRLGASCFVDEVEEMRSKASALENAIKQTKRQVIEAIFGEFRENIMMVRKALSEYDVAKAHDELDRLERVMFGITDE